MIRRTTDIHNYPPPTCHPNLCGCYKLHFHASFLLVGRLPGAGRARLASMHPTQLQQPWPFTLLLFLVLVLLRSSATHMYIPIANSSRPNKDFTHHHDPAQTRVAAVALQNHTVVSWEGLHGAASHAGAAEEQRTHHSLQPLGARPAATYAFLLGNILLQ